MVPNSGDLLLVRNPLLGADLETGFLALGLVPRVLEPAQVTLTELERARRAGFRSLLTVNRSPEVALACREAGLRYLSWTIDPLPRIRWTVIPDVDEEMFVHRKALLPPLTAMGHRAVEWLPLSAPARRWTDPVVPRASSRPSFVGSSLRDERNFFEGRLRDWGLGAAVESLVGFLDSVAEVAERDLSFQGFLARPGGVPEPLVRAAEGVVDRLDLAEALDAGLAWRFRRRVVSGMARLGCEVRGDEGWVESCGSSWSGLLRNGQEMSAHYRAAALDLDVPRLHQRGIATLRAFDVLACGGVLCLEAGTELEELFRSGEHYLDWRSPEERDAKIREAIAGSSTDGDRISAAGREAAWEHRLEVRLRRILLAHGR
jgi:hypothetical protein